MAERQLNRLDLGISQLDTLLRRLSTTPRASRPSPAKTVVNPSDMSADERQHAAGLMRVNHVGEVCAQALYLGQAAVARDQQLKTHLQQAATEETDHLAWCAERLHELNDRPSLLNPLWFAGAYGIGMVAGLAGDGWNLGFVVETERQVEAHLDDHLQRLPAQDLRSRAIVGQMKHDEAAHAESAQALGAKSLPAPVRVLMRGSAKLMTTVAYRI